MNLEKLNSQDILALLPQTAQSKICVLDCVPSTNDYLFNLIQNGDYSTAVVLAEYQTAGKGRQGNVWNSPLGNLYLSLHKQFACELKDLYGLSLAVGVAVARVLKTNGLYDVKLKWPNDIYWQGRKMGGVLIETKSHAQAIDTIIGIGLNIKDQTSPQFVCLEDALQRKVYRNKLIAQILNELSLVLETFAKSGFDAFKEEWVTMEFVKA